eukprot:scaffold15824_cov85-Cylindrotheca_fusiformis.AAC.2
MDSRARSPIATLEEARGGEENILGFRLPEDEGAAATAFVVLAAENMAEERTKDMVQFFD